MILFNSLSKKKEQFLPINPHHITMYVCGPTVYDIPHIGNARSVIIYDILFRLLQAIYPKISYVRNITDVDDKICIAAKNKNQSIQTLTENIIKEFNDDMAFLNALSPTLQPKATENIDAMIGMIKKLISDKHAYVSHDHVLFAVDSYKKYGHLSRRKKEEMMAGARIEKAEYKKNPLDFVLWKPPGEYDNESTIFDSPWGKGRPGWHIECSAMSMKYLGNNFDIHGGGSDLQFPHHENEIAQSCCFDPKSTFAKYWVHNGFLMVNGEKMSKSLGNFITIRDLIKRNIKGVVVRFVLLKTHYRKPLDFKEQSLKEAEQIMNRLHKILFAQKLKDADDDSKKPSIINDLKDDLNIPKAISNLFIMEKKIKTLNNQNDKNNVILDLYKSMKILGLYDENYFTKNDNLNPNKTLIEEKINLRSLAKKEKNYQLADQIKNELLNMGVKIMDQSDGSCKWQIN